MKLFVLAIVVAASLLATSVSGLDNGVGRLPPMGWNTWCTEGRCGRDVCNSEEILSIAHAVVDSGMASAGYKYINLDDCWGGKRDAQGHYQADPDRFPPSKDGSSGMKVLADTLHEMGLRYGLYTDGGKYTCSQGERPYKIPGSYGHFEDDAKTFASWGMDYVKMDWCNSEGETPEQAYRNMSLALNATGRPIYFLACEWGVDTPSQWMRTYANAWRATGDHHDEWASTQEIIEQVADLAVYGGCFDDGRGCGWNYMDFLMTGGQGCADNLPGHRCPGQTDVEYRTEAAIWVIAASPLIVATDVRNMSAIQKEILLNEEMIAIHQDPLARAGGRVGTWACDAKQNSTYPACQLWSRNLANGDKAIVMYNTDLIAHNITFPFHVIGMPNSHLAVRDVFGHADKGTFVDEFTAQVESHGVFFGRVKCVAGDCK